MWLFTYFALLHTGYGFSNTDQNLNFPAIKPDFNSDSELLIYRTLETEYNEHDSQCWDSYFKK